MLDNDIIDQLSDVSTLDLFVRYDDTLLFVRLKKTAKKPHTLIDQV